MPIGGAWNEGFADGATPFAADGDVLKVGLVGGESSGGGLKLPVMGMNAVRGRIDREGEGVDVGALQFGELTVFEEVSDDGVLGGKGGEDLLVSGVLPGFGFFGFLNELEFIEEDFTELFG